MSLRPRLPDPEEIPLDTAQGSSILPGLRGLLRNFWDGLGRACTEPEVCSSCPYMGDGDECPGPSHCSLVQEYQNFK